MQKLTGEEKEEEEDEKRGMEEERKRVIDGPHPFQLRGSWQQAVLT